MSTFTVEIAKILEVTKHPNADRLDLVKVKGWQVVAASGQYQSGDMVIYCPIDAVLPLELSDKMDVTKYLSKQRVRTARLRGEYSQGLLIPMFFLDGVKPMKLNPECGLLPGTLLDWEVGMDVKDVLQIKKYDPPVPINMAGQVAPHNPNFPKYTDIENIKNFPDVLQEGEEVVITEKIHGTNFRVGIVDGELMVGSHNWPLVETEGNLYWRVVRENPRIEEALRNATTSPANVIFFGEIYGKGIQKGLDYGAEKPQVRFFDLMVDGEYISDEGLTDFLMLKHLNKVPTLYKGPFCKAEHMKLADGPSTLSNHIKEGIVIAPVVPRVDYKLGRVKLKHISEAYLMKDYGDLH